MSSRLRWILPVLLSIARPTPAPGQGSHFAPKGTPTHAVGPRSIASRAVFAVQRGGHSPAGGLTISQHSVGGGHGGAYLGAVGGGGFFGFGYGAVPIFYPPPLIAVGPGAWAPIFNPYAPQSFPPNFPVPVGGQGGGGLMLPLPPRDLVEAPTPRPRRPNPARAKEQVEIGDRSFRGGNTKRAEERFQQAAKADPTSPIPHVHLAQVDLVRGDYASAAESLRDAVTVAADPAWLLSAPDIQSMFAEPADFARHLAKLESHLQAHPGDRDAWFVLGAEAYLSGRSKQAADVFQRLSDRRPDEALAAFLDASTPRKPAE